MSQWASSTLFPHGLVTRGCPMWLWGSGCTSGLSLGKCELGTFFRLLLWGWEAWIPNLEGPWAVSQFLPIPGHLFRKASKTDVVGASTHAQSRGRAFPHMCSQRGFRCIHSHTTTRGHLGLPARGRGVVCGGLGSVRICSVVVEGCLFCFASSEPWPWFCCGQSRVALPTPPPPPAPHFLCTYLISSIAPGSLSLAI